MPSQEAELLEQIKSELIALHRSLSRLQLDVGNLWSALQPVLEKMLREQPPEQTRQ